MCLRQVQDVKGGRIFNLNRRITTDERTVDNPSDVRTVVWEQGCMGLYNAYNVNAIVQLTVMPNCRYMKCICNEHRMMHMCVNC
jgi:hypothetical protein